MIKTELVEANIVPDSPKVALGQVVLRLRDSEQAIIVDQIKQGGLGSELLIESMNDPERMVHLDNLLLWLYTQRMGVQFMTFLGNKF